MGNSLGSSNNSDLNFRNSSRPSLATSRESLSRTSIVTRDGSLADAGMVVPRRQRRRQSARRNEAVLLSLSRLIVETGRHADWVDVNDSWDEQKVETLIEALLLAPRQQGLDEPLAEYQEECPICFYFYSQVNRSSCCNKPICTNCFVYIQRKIRKKCPYCNKCGLEVYLPKRSCSSDTESQETKRRSYKDKENVSVEQRGLSTCSCEESIDSLSNRKKFEEYSDFSLVEETLPAPGLRTREDCLSGVKEDLVAYREGDIQLENCHHDAFEEEDTKEYSLIDTSEWFAPDSNRDVSLSEQICDAEDVKEGFLEEEMMEQHSETLTWIHEHSGLRSFVRNRDEKLLDFLALTTSGNTVSPELVSMDRFLPSERDEHFDILSGRTDEWNEKSHFCIEENDDMFMQLFEVERSCDNSVGVDNLIHLHSDEEKET
ncbi:hypothetical protein GpartN1_g3670.t1 [Galdieria partita]|uniref:RING-type domain-containing protein n=1 Tax=Galdieria partita TaxID=83374 RepID=A0A9C7PWN6_9RHOD|nr:hypothetical protein GpartN1_g3670.t1 [Galdieria partita]